VNDQPEEPARETPLLAWSKVVLRGVGQVMFQDHALCGLLFLLGIAVASPQMALGGLAGSVIGTAVARLLRLDEGEIRDGIYGFNGTLVGVAAFFFLKPFAPAIVLMIAAGAVSTVVTWLMRRYLPFPTYTLPFIVTTWAMVAVAGSLGLPRVVLPPPPHVFDISSALSEGLSEVFLQANRFTGLLFLAGLAVSNWRHAVLGWLGSAIGTAVAIYHSDDVGNLSIGIYGYNAALAAIGLYFWRKSLLIPILGALVSTPITEFFPRTGLPTLTAPFVLACWVVIAAGAVERLFLPEDGKASP